MLIINQSMSRIVVSSFLILYYNNLNKNNKNQSKKVKRSFITDPDYFTTFKSSVDIKVPSLYAILIFSCVVARQSEKNQSEKEDNLGILFIFQLIHLSLRKLGASCFF